MSTRSTPPTTMGSAGRERSARSAPAETIRLILIALAIFVIVAGITLAIGLVTGAVLLFNIVVWTLFTVLWIAFMAALAFSRATLDDVWNSVRGLPLVIQGLAWLLFLPIMIGLWIWERPWSMPTRLVLSIALGAFNVFLFFP